MILNETFYFILADSCSISIQFVSLNFIHGKGTAHSGLPICFEILTLFSFPTIPHKTIETNKKKTLPSINVESGAHLGFNIDLGRGESILKESEWTWMIGETNFSDGLNIFCEIL